MDEFENYVAPYSSEYWEREQARNEEQARFHGNIAIGLGAFGGAPGRVVGAFEAFRASAHASTAAEMGRRAKEAKAREDAAKERAAQAERERAEREKRERERQQQEQADRNYREWGIRKPALELGRDLPEPSIHKDFGNVA